MAVGVVQGGADVAAAGFGDASRGVGEEVPAGTEQLGDFHGVHLGELGDLGAEEEEA